MDVLGPVDLATVVVVPGKGPIRAVTGPPGRGLNLLGEKAAVGGLPPPPPRPKATPGLSATTSTSGAVAAG